jgi:pyruvate ferredoxin oxidoreductase beta subunit
MHSLFENAPATISGIEAAYKSLKSKGKIKDDIKFLAIGGDGSSYDIGFQSLSGALERGHDFVYIAYDNEGYMNTGNQKSSATPFGAYTTTCPAGKLGQGKKTFRKNLTEICAAHRIPYVAQSAIHAYSDLTEKVKKAFQNTPAVIVVLEPCVVNWGFPSDMTVQMSRMASDTCFWPLYEIENGKYTINYKPQNKLPLGEFLRGQARFKHLFKDENRHLIEKMQQDVDSEWERLLKLASQ